MHDAKWFKERRMSLLTTQLVIGILLMILAGTNLALGVLLRPILRITKDEFKGEVGFICDALMATGMFQILSAGYNILSACWNVISAISLGIVVTSIVVLGEMSTMGAVFYLRTRAEFLSNEDVLHPWYWVECRKTTSCRESILSYIYTYMIPQSGLCAVAIFLQCLGMMYLVRLVRCNIGNQKRLHKSALKAAKEKEKKVANAAPVNQTPKKNGTNGNNLEMTPMNGNIPGTPQQLPAELRTPSSILKVDHGYVPASGRSLDFDHNMLRSRQKRVTQTKSITFNHEVQVHHFDTSSQANVKEDV